MAEPLNRFSLAPTLIMAACLTCMWIKKNRMDYQTLSGRILCAALFLFLFCVFLACARLLYRSDFSHSLPNNLHT